MNNNAIRIVIFFLELLPENVCGTILSDVVLCFFSSIVFLWVAICCSYVNVDTCLFSYMWKYLGVIFGVLFLLKEVELFYPQSPNRFSGNQVSWNIQIFVNFSLTMTISCSVSFWPCIGYWSARKISSQRLESVIALTSVLQNVFLPINQWL